MPSRPVTRRALFGAGIGVAAAALLAGGGAAVDDGVVPGRSTMYRVLGLDGPNGVVPSVATGPLESGEFTSKHLGRAVAFEIAYPPGAADGAALPVAVVLHGYGGDQSTAFGPTLCFDAYLAQAVEDGVPPFALASVSGGNGYWHRRVNGTDAGAMVTDELLPRLASRGLRATDSDRVALLGWSMGGYGALLLAGRLGRKRVAAAGALSPALWHSFGKTPKGAFDSARDFARNDLYGRQRELDGIAVRVDCGTGDGFYPNAQNYVDGFSTRPAGGFEKGGHDAGYWRRLAPAQLAFLGRALTSA